MHDLPPRRIGWLPGPPGVRLRPHFGLLPSFWCRNFCYIFVWIVPTPYHVNSCVFFPFCFCQENFQQDLGVMASLSSPKDKFVVKVINPYLAEVKKHPQTL